MKANKKSIHARLYKITYSSALPQNLCPYFWKLILATVVFIPNFIIQLPVLIYDLFTGGDNDSPKEKIENGFFTYFALGLLFLYLTSQYYLIKAAFGCYSYEKGFANGGLIVDGFIVGLITFGVIGSIFEKRQNNDKEPSIISEFIKAKYNKYCPKIDWK